jgi:hypothetical protein
MSALGGRLSCHATPQAAHSTLTLLRLHSTEPHGFIKFVRAIYLLQKVKDQAFLFINLQGRHRQALDVQQRPSKKLGSDQTFV